MSHRCRLAALLPCLLVLAGTAATQGFHQREPNRYSQARDDNLVTALNRRVAAGEAKLPLEGRSGRLQGLLRALAVPASSQTLVFSKTSLQRHRISRQNPRALYFGPDVYVGWVPGASALEVAAGDPNLGLVFYTLSQVADEPPILRRDDSCLSCHAGSRTDDEPGLLLRSVFPDEAGDPIASAGESSVTLSSPLDERWGGWLVTGQFDGGHRGNGVARRDEHGLWSVPGRKAADLTAFAAEFAIADYPVPTSDIAALLALEQQVTIHNLLIRASLQMRCLLDGDQAINAMLGESGVRAPTARIADTLARTIATTLLLGDEASLAGRAAAPAPAFAVDFPALSPRDDRGVQLGRLDLGERLFTLPLSPMVHAPAFASLPTELRRRVLERLHAALEPGRGRLPIGVVATKAQRLVLHDHLRATLADY